MSQLRLGEVLLGVPILVGLGCLVASPYVSSPALANNLIIGSVGLASVGIVAYVVEFWRSGALGIAAPPEAGVYPEDEPPTAAQIAKGDRQAH